MRDNENANRANDAGRRPVTPDRADRLRSRGRAARGAGDQARRRARRRGHPRRGPRRRRAAARWSAGVGVPARAARGRPAPGDRPGDERAGGPGPGSGRKPGGTPPRIAPAWAPTKICRSRRWPAALRVHHRSSTPSSVPNRSRSRPNQPHRHRLHRCRSRTRSRRLRSCRRSAVGSSDSPPGTPKQETFVGEASACAICQRGFQAASEAEIARSGWTVRGDVGLCPECQADRWPLPEGARIPFKRGG